MIKESTERESMARMKKEKTEHRSVHVTKRESSKEVPLAPGPGPGLPVCKARADLRQTETGRWRPEIETYFVLASMLLSKKSERQAIVGGTQLYCRKKQAAFLDRPKKGNTGKVDCRDNMSLRILNVQRPKSALTTPILWRKNASQTSWLDRCKLRVVNTALHG